MPRKTPSKVAPVSGQVEKIKCPACQSEIGSSGSVLYKKSAYLEDLQETDGNVVEIEKEVTALEEKLAISKKRVAELELQLKEKTEKEKVPDASVPKEGKPKSGWGW